MRSGYKDGPPCKPTFTTRLRPQRIGNLCPRETIVVFPADLLFNLPTGYTWAWWQGKKAQVRLRQLNVGKKEEENEKRKKNIYDNQLLNNILYYNNNNAATTTICSMDNIIIVGDLRL